MGVLYKYTTGKGVEYILEGGSLCFSSTTELNDPFEIGVDGEGAIWNMNRDFLWSLKLESANLRFAERVKTYVDPAYEPKPQERVTDETWEWFIKRTAWVASRGYSRQIGVLSLGKSPSELLMWSHYGDSWRGLVFGFDDEDPAMRESCYAGMVGPQEVRYRSGRPQLTEATPQERIANMCLTKSDCWSYEQEVRCFREVRDRRLLAPFSPKSLVKIVLGPNMGFETIKRRVALRDESIVTQKSFLRLPTLQPSAWT